MHYRAELPNNFPEKSDRNFSEEFSSLAKKWHCVCNLLPAFRQEGDCSDIQAFYGQAWG